MFRFSIRDLLWLTLVVAMGLGWGIREWQVRDKEAAMDLAINNAKLWRGGAGALEMHLKQSGYDVTWKLDDWTVNVASEENKAPIWGETLYNLKYCNPSTDQ